MNTTMAYIECDVPEGQTLTDWRRDHGDHRVRTARRVVRGLARRIAG